jgi:hypothetical protein
VAPEIVVEALIGGKRVVGVIKIHISKGSPFDFKQSKIVAYTVFKLLENEFSSNGTEVLPELCFCLDIFAGKIISAQNTDSSILMELEKICEEIKALYNAA